MSTFTFSPPLLLLTAAVALAGCSDGTTPTPTLTASAVAGSDGQSTVAGVALPQPLRVLVQQGESPKAGVTVTWTTSAGTVTPTSSVTDPQGVAATRWTLGSTPGSMTATATVASAEGSPVTFHAAALTRPGMVASVVSGNRQTGQVGAPLSIPLKVQIQTFGPTNAGVTVTWSPADGQVTPSSSITDAAGYATTSWTLGTAAKDTQTVLARISGAEGSPLVFTAKALPGPATRLAVYAGDLQTSYAGATYTTPFGPLLATAADQYGNGIPSQPVAWSVVSGPVHLVSTTGPTDQDGIARAEVAPDGPAGDAVVQATLGSGTATANFSLTITPMEHFVVLQPYASFTSAANGSSPAVDTIAAGTTMRWLIVQDWDYDDHSIDPDGIPSFPSQLVGCGIPGMASITFTTPGTYHYSDSGDATASGILVVQ